MSETPNAAPVAGVLAGHGILLAACGVYGSYSSNWAPKAMHSAYAGLGGCAILLLSAGMSVGGTRKLYMIGVHVGLLFQLMFTGVFGLQAFRSYGVAEKADRFPLFCVMGIGSLVALGAMRYFKPKTKEKK
eukprot:CAMPEP_0181195378 /NCGR_PEP_ID=MMETSP1096-20121128/14853_1 /TAXON_ID=156174 ORGANISM="Chrysochromulina ericina, Strain CCMP281" /NCGR_SAMPLE_ID=MMETSP1096 /ASSEMBLY_ACC=CAM_ASM_000453 /LENGTH=130 /DNA_ID=CAMNT_0023284973 /DNA_START=14 /DNA_END=406 /DNA_ORIENTATION=-